MRACKKIKVRNITAYEEGIIEGEEIGLRKGLKDSLQFSVDEGLMDQSHVNGFVDGFMRGRVFGMIDCLIVAVEMKFGLIDESLNTHLETLGSVYEIRRVQLMLDWYDTYGEFYTHLVDFIASDRRPWFVAGRAPKKSDDLEK